MYTQLKLNPFEIRETTELNLINNGVLSEQLPAQHNDFQEPELYYWAREKKAASSEVDFVITDNKHRVIPVEVKSGSTGSMRSLQIMVFEKKLSHAVRFNSSPPSVFHEIKKTVLGEIEYRLYSLPHYLSGQLIRLMNETK